LEAWKPKIKVLANPVPGGDCFLVCIWLPSACVLTCQTGSKGRREREREEEEQEEEEGKEERRKVEIDYNTNAIMKATLMTSFNHNCLPKASPSNILTLEP
jgi:hypothetical protein